MSDGHMGSVNWDGCEDCEYRDDENDGCLTCGPEVELDMGDWWKCIYYEYGDPQTQEDVEAEEARRRFEEIDQYQERLKL